MGKLQQDGFFESLENELSALKRNDAMNAVPHMILSHAFMGFQDRLGIPWGERENYDFFFSLLAFNLPTMAEFNEEERSALKEKGWQAYLED